MITVCNQYNKVYWMPKFTQKMGGASIWQVLIAFGFNYSIADLTWRLPCKDQLLSDSADFQPFPLTGWNALVFCVLAVFEWYQQRSLNREQKYCAWKSRAWLWFWSVLALTVICLRPSPHLFASLPFQNKTTRVFQVWLLSKQAIVHSKEITVKDKGRKQNRNRRTSHLSSWQLPTKQRGVWIWAQGVVETVPALVKYKYGALSQVCPGLWGLLLWLYRPAGHHCNSAWSLEYIFCFYFFTFTRSVHLLVSECYLADSSLKLVTKSVFSFL